MVQFSAASEGRKITLDPIDEIRTNLTVREVESTIPCGFRVSWINGEANEVDIEMLAGAGVGSKWLIIHVGGRQFCADMLEWFETFARTILNDNEVGDPSTTMHDPDDPEYMGDPDYHERMD